MAGNCRPRHGLGLVGRTATWAKATAAALTKVLLAAPPLQAAHAQALRRTATHLAKLCTRNGGVRRTATSADAATLAHAARSARAPAPSRPLGARAAQPSSAPAAAAPPGGTVSAYSWARLRPSRRGSRRRCRGLILLPPELRKVQLVLALQVRGLGAHPRPPVAIRLSIDKALDYG
jgi:hypothetical protein